MGLTDTGDLTLLIPSEVAISAPLNSVMFIRLKGGGPRQGRHYVEGMGRGERGGVTVKARAAHSLSLWEMG